MPASISQIRSLEAGPRVLPAPFTTASIASACRAAVQDFCASGDPPWTRLSLARWLSGSYRPLVGVANRGVAVSSVPPSRRSVSQEEVDKVMLSARHGIGAVLWGIAAKEDVSFSYAAIREGWVERCRDAQEVRGWVPVSRSGMLLVERVQSLLAVDYLVNPRAYTEQISLCPTCGALSFTGVRRGCVKHPEHVTRLTAARL